MTERCRLAPPGVYAAADHLDSILAAAEDLLALKGGSGQNELVRLELVAITHALQARQRLGEQPFADRALAHHAALFLTGTAALESTPSVTAAPPAAPPISQAYLIGRAMSVGELMQRASAMLDALENVFVLYDDEGEGREACPPPSSAQLAPSPESMP
jgi:hypothetical protein